MISSAFARWQKMPSAGFVAAMGAFLAWGFLPLYWNLFSGLNPLEILSYRIIFSAFVLFIPPPLARKQQCRSRKNDVRVDPERCRSTHTHTQGRG